MNFIGLNKSESENLSKKLNILLANYQVFYQNARGYHWNIKGDKFFELHAKFEELYNDLFVKIDELAERVLTLGFSPVHKYSQISVLSTIKESDEGEDGKAVVKEILESLQTIIVLQREILGISDEANDEGTNALMSDYIREQEKLAWMYNAYLN